MPELLLSFESSDDSLSVRRFAVREEMSALFNAAVWARSPNDDLDFEAFIGKPATLRVADAPKGGGPEARTFAGICNHMEQVQVEATGLSTYLVNIVPRLWLLTQRTNNRLFQHLSIPAIVDQVLGEWSVPHRFEIQGGDYPELELRVQYGESDYAFVCRLIEEAGIAFTFPDDAAGAVMVLCDAPQGNEARAGGPVQFHDNPAHTHGREWVTRVRVAREVRPGQVTLRDFDFRRNPVFPLYAANGGGAPVEAALEQYRYAPGSFLVEVDPGAVQKMTDAAAQAGGGGDPASDLVGKLTSGLGIVDVVSGLPGDDKGMARTSEKAGVTRAQRHLESARVSHKTVAFDTNLVTLPPGTVFSVGVHPRADMDPAHTLLITAFSLDGEHDKDWTMSARAVFTDAPYRPPLVTPRPAIKGVQTAIVTGPGGDEVYTDELGRVRVQFHWDRQGRHDDSSSCWMRVNQGWAGSGFGIIALPRVGQEVLIAFLEGNPDQPVVVGRLFNSTTTPPYPLPDDRTKSGWKSASSPGGGGFNELSFDDAKGEELVSFQAEKDLEKLVKNNELVTVGAQRRSLIGTVDETRVGQRHTVSVGGASGLTYTEISDQKIHLSTGKASITLDGPDITLQAEGKIFLHSTGGDVELLGGPWVKINCGPADADVDHELTLTDPFGNPLARSFLHAELSVDGGATETHEAYTSRVIRIPPGQQGSVTFTLVEPDDDKKGGTCG